MEKKKPSECVLSKIEWLTKDMLYSFLVLVAAATDRAGGEMTDVIDKFAPDIFDEGSKESYDIILDSSQEIEDKSSND